MSISVHRTQRVVPGVHFFEEGAHSYERELDTVFSLRGKINSPLSESYANVSTRGQSFRRASAKGWYIWICTHLHAIHAPRAFVVIVLEEELTIKLERQHKDNSLDAR